MDQLEYEESMDDQQHYTAHTGESPSGLDLGALYVLVGVMLLLPIFFLPFISFPFQVTKIALVLVGVLVSFALLITSSLRKGFFTFPFNLVVVGAWLIPVTYFFSALLAPSSLLTSLIGQRFDSGTVLFVTLATLLLTLVPLLIKERQQILGIYTGFLFIFVLLILFQGLRLIFGPEFLSLGIFTSVTANLIGKWNDLAIFFGITAMLSMVTLEGLRLHVASKVVLYGVLIISLIFLAIINFTYVWVTLGVFALGFFIYNLLKRKFSFSPQESLPIEEESLLQKFGISCASLSVLVIALIFFFGGDTLGNSIGEFFNIGQLEARPSWESTVDIARATYQDNLLLGSGPNTFQAQWAQFRPEGVNLSNFWNVDFNTGIAYVPTAFVTVGILGGLAWVIFLGLLLYSGVRSLLLRSFNDSFSYYLSLSSFLVALYLWVFSVIYTPNAVILLLAFFFTGLYLASLRHQGSDFKEKTIIFAENPRLGFVFVLTLTVLLIFTVVGTYLVGNRYIASVYFQRAIFKLTNEGNEIDARRMLTKAQEKVSLDTFSRFGVDLELRKLTALLADSDLSPEQQREEFEDVLTAAIETAQSARDLDPNNYQNWFTLGRVYQSITPLQIQGSYENAKEAYDQALVRAPHNPSIYLARAELEVLNGNGEEARVYIGKALEAKRNYTAAVFLLAQIQVNEGLLSDAIQSVEAATLLEPNNPVIFFQLGLLRYNQSDWRGAAEAFERAVSLNEVYANARYFYGLSLYQLGDVDNAIIQFESVRETNPDNVEVQQILLNLRSGEAPLVGFEEIEEPQNRTNPPIEGE